MGDLPTITVSEVAITDEKFEPDMSLSSYQDPTQPDCTTIIHHYQDNDHKTSYVDVAESDGLDDDIVVNKNVVSGGSNDSPKLDTMVDDQVAELDAQNEKLDEASGEVSELQKVEKNRNVKWDDDDEFPPLVSRATTRQESSLEDGHGFQVRFVNSLDEHNSRTTKSWLDVVKERDRRFDVKVKPGIRNSFSVSSSEEITGDVFRVKVSNSIDVKNGGARISSFRRLGTLNGLSLEPDEERVEMVSTPVEVGSVSQIPTLELKQEMVVEFATSDDKMPKKTSKHKNQNLAKKGTTEVVLKNGFVVLSAVDVIDEVQQNEAAKDVESTREATEADSKEQHWLEELAKANETCERKTRQVKLHNMQEREKRLRKKERNKAAAAAARDVHDVDHDFGTATGSYSSVGIIDDIEVEDMSSMMPKKPQQHRTSSTNWSKNIHRQSMWVGSICIVTFVVLLWLRNIGVCFQR